MFDLFINIFLVSLPSLSAQKKPLPTFFNEEHILIHFKANHNGKFFQNEVFKMFPKVFLGSLRFSKVP